MLIPSGARNLLSVSVQEEADFSRKPCPGKDGLPGFSAAS
jgi:hypothetical protein